MIRATRHFMSELKLRPPKVKKHLGGRALRPWKPRRMARGFVQGLTSLSENCTEALSG